MISIKKLKAVNTLEDLQNLNLGPVHWAVTHRGGHVGFSCDDIAKHLVVLADFLPPNYGAFCNYLGGGVRGVIMESGYSSNMEMFPKKIKWLNELSAACVRVYKSIENEIGLNELEDENGEINWDAMATKAARNSGQKSAY